MQINPDIHQKLKGRWVPYKMISSNTSTMNEFCASNLFGVYMNAFEISEKGKYKPTVYCPPDFNNVSLVGIYELDESNKSIVFTEIFDNRDSIHFPYNYEFITDDEILFSTSITNLFVKKLK